VPAPEEISFVVILSIKEMISVSSSLGDTIIGSSLSLPFAWVAPKLRMVALATSEFSDPSTLLTSSSVALSVFSESSLLVDVSRRLIAIAKESCSSSPRPLNKRRAVSRAMPVPAFSPDSLPRMEDAMELNMEGRSRRQILDGGPSSEEGVITSLLSFESALDLF